MQAELRMGMAVPDHEYDAIMKEVRKASRIGIYTKDKSGQFYRFYLKDGVLMSDCRNIKTDEKVVREVLKLSVVLKNGVDASTSK